MARHDDRSRRSGRPQDDRDRRGAGYQGPVQQGQYRDEDDVFDRDRWQTQAYDDGSRSRGMNHPYSGGYGGYGQRDFDEGGYGGGWGNEGRFPGQRPLGAGPGSQPQHGGGYRPQDSFGRTPGGFWDTGEYGDQGRAFDERRGSAYGRSQDQRYGDRYGHERYGNERHGLDRDAGLRQRVDEGYDASDWRHSNDQNQFDPDYWQWRQEQVRALDNDYRSWREDRYKKFSDDFSQWRSQRPREGQGGQGSGVIHDSTTSQSAASSAASSGSKGGNKS